MIVQLDPASISFPPTATALHEPNGLLAVGGDLSPGRLIHAYQQGIFPWFSDNDPILWWSPNPRAVFLPDKIHISRSLAKTNRKSNWQITINRCFVDVVRACADQRSDNEGTWITEEMIEAYCKLHKLGHAHSVEVWFDNELAGGLYGISVGRAFCGESMFHYKTDASKIALLRFAQHFNEQGGQLIDCQVGNPHLFSLGAANLHRERFLMKLNIAQQQPMPDTFWQAREIPNSGEL
ncbi:leucyl/phenylalanyl-tRNA--protein transferase [Idiomarina ramblicola]|uniref:Leucyl/phenylalanyl-tRNA--protein transferase n=1 Tax=Idiomarina ramblicola TaxID=263724 RepID=A0A432Z4W5_9GAMM|nr:leucyl/phenylalanyl-tRNA--protein transferase [Idiomarina ramblicola]RUO72930.1 leucyl/phenylalanyl-tRNA--protein transferase [Idiomarina ramblicola]